MATIPSDATYVKIYENAFQSIVLNAKRLLVSELDKEEIKNDQEYVTNVEEKPNVLKCSYCNMIFDNLAQQREHYKSDWHRYNLNRRIEAQVSVTEEQFNLISLNEEENQSDSDSSDDSEEEELTYRGCAFYKNDQQQVFSLYKCFMATEDNEIVACQKDKVWTVLMVSGGHFAGAVFHNGEVLLHKTFHSYTVRAKQGGSQAATDNRKGSSYPKSAGASLRRQNNAVFVQHIQEVLLEWKAHIENSAYIFYRAAGPHNRAILFGGKYPPLVKTGKNLRIIPFSTRRPTFAEVQHVYAKLTSVNVYCNREEVLQMIQKTPTLPKAPKKTAASAKPAAAANDANGADSTKEESPKKPQHQKDYEKNKAPVADDSAAVASSSSSDEGPVELIMNDEEISMTDALQAFQMTRRPRRRNKNKVNDRKTLIDATNAGNLDLVQQLLTDKLKNLLNDPMDDAKNRLLHFASKNGHTNLVTWLLDAGANPCLRDRDNRPPFALSKDIAVAERFKRFAALNPNRYDYDKAQIPHEEAAKRKKKEDKKRRKRDQEAVDQFLALSDAQKHQSRLKRCFECGLQMEENAVPFQYSAFNFCSIDCLKDHRTKNAAK